MQLSVPNYGSVDTNVQRECACVCVCNTYRYDDSYWVIFQHRSLIVIIYGSAWLAVLWAASVGLSCTVSSSQRFIGAQHRNYCLICIICIVLTPVWRTRRPGLWRSCCFLFAADRTVEDEGDHLDWEHIQLCFKTVGLLILMTNIVLFWCFILV